MAQLSVKAAVIAAIGVVAIGYTNCSKVNFETTDPGSLSNALSENEITTAAVIINNGAEATNKLEVGLILESDSATEMYITNTSDCRTDGQWETYAKRKTWKLATANKSDVVYAKFRKTVNDKVIESECVSDAILHDNIPPVIAVHRPAGSLFNLNQMQIELSIVDELSGVGIVTCDSDDTLKSVCGGGISTLAISEGLHWLQVQATDKAGNKSEILSDSFVIDLSPPTLVLNSTPAALTGSTAAAFSFSGSDNLAGLAGFECQLGTTAFAACTSPFSATVAAGQNTFQVRAIDKAGNISAPLSYSWVVDLSAPTIQLTSTPAAVNNQATAQFTFVGTDNGQPLTNFQCQIDGGTAAACTSPLNLTGLSEGRHTFSLVGIDSVGNRSAPVTYSWVIDRTAPVLTLVSGPAARTSNVLATFVFTTSDSGSGISAGQCSLDGAAYSACTSPKNITVASGGHTLRLRAVDNAGNISPVITRTWFVDTVAPVVTLTSTPAATADVSAATFAFTATDADGGSIASTECRLDGGTWSACSSPHDIADLVNGSHTFDVRATDSVGLVSNPASYTWNVNVTVKVICDPFGSTKVTKPGLAARLSYYGGATPWEDIKYVDDVFNKGIKVEDTVILFSSVSVPTRKFTSGFDAGGGAKLKNAAGENLVEWFALDYTSNMKLADTDEEGTYQVATLSDDGSILYLDTGSGLMPAVNNDGFTPTRFACGSTITIHHGDRIPMRLKYFQGPRDEISVNLMWRKVSDSTDLNPSYCGLTGSFWDPYTQDAWGNFTNLQAQGWKVMAPENFELVDVIPNVCK